jgi:hypothetical protein
MKIFTLQQLGLTFCQPIGSGQGLTLGAMAVGAGVVCVPFVIALVTAFQMATERRGTAPFDGTQHPLLHPGQRFGMCLAKLVAMGAYDVGDFECRPHQNRDLRLRNDDRIRK